MEGHTLMRTVWGRVLPVVRCRALWGAIALWAVVAAICAWRWGPPGAARALVPSGFASAFAVAFLLARSGARSEHVRAAAVASGVPALLAALPLPFYFQTEFEHAELDGWVFLVMLPWLVPILATLCYAPALAGEWLGRALRGSSAPISGSTRASGG